MHFTSANLADASASPAERSVIAASWGGRERVVLRESVVQPSNRHGAVGDGCGMVRDSWWQMSDSAWQIRDR